jgi:enoyl-[acyl-carrier-protein] reductase (NADH)
LLVFAGFTEGKWSPDVGFMLAETVMKMVATIGFTGDVKKFRISMQDLTNKNEMKAILNIKSKNEELEKAAKSLGKDIKAMPEQKGLMAPPQPQEEEVA